MAYLKLPETLKTQKPAQAGQGITQAATGGQISSVAPQTAFMRPTGTATGQPSSQSSGASRFVNFDRVLSANAPGAKGMAQDVLSKAAEQGQKAEQLTKEASKTFKTDVEKGTQKYTPSYIWNAGKEADLGIGSVPSQKTGERVITSEQAQKGAETGYAGPKADEFQQREAYKQAQQAANEAKLTRNALATDTGLEALLNQMYGTTGGTGGSRLDAALARVAGGPSYEASRQRFAGLENLLTQAATQAQQQAQAGEATSTMTQQQYKDLMKDYEVRRAEESQLAYERSIEAEAARARARDAAAKEQRETKWSRDRVPLDERVSTIDEETQAAMMGMSLEDWIAAGRPWGRS